jgi:hypothetical protein
LQVAFFLCGDTKRHEKSKQQGNHEAPQDGIARAARPEE